MKRITSALLIESILRRAPHQAQHRISSVFYGLPNQTGRKQKLDQAYIQTFLHQTQCEFLLNRNFKIREFRRLQASQGGPIFIDKKSQKQTRSYAQKSLLAAIKRLNDHKGAYDTYSEAEQTVLMMTPEDALKNKRYLVYIYKWILNQRTWPNQELQRMGAQLKQVVVGKIYEGHEKKEEQAKAKEELEKIASKINEKIELEKQKEKQQIEKIISSYKDKNQPFKSADKNKQ